MKPRIDRVPAVLQACNPGQREARAGGNPLGEVNPSGHLPSPLTAMGR